MFTKPENPPKDSANLSTPQYLNLTLKGNNNNPIIPVVK